MFSEIGVDVGRVALSPRQAEVVGVEVDSGPARDTENSGATARRPTFCARHLMAKLLGRRVINGSALLEVEPFGNPKR